MKLVEYIGTAFYRGTVLRFKGKYPFTDEYTDFMIMDYPGCDEEQCPLALYCVSGYHAGSLEYVFPVEARSKDSVSIEKDWLIENWSKRIYGECNVDDVEIVIR